MYSRGKKGDYRGLLGALMMFILSNNNYIYWPFLFASFSFPSKLENMKKKQKVHIDEYESFYPVLLVVANKYATAKDLNKKYMWPDGCDITDQELDAQIGFTCALSRRSDNRKVLLVKFCGYNGNLKTKSEITKDLWQTAVHEAGHVVLTTYSEIDDKISTNFKRQEPFCYYLEWVATCIYETISK